MRAIFISPALCEKFKQQPFILVWDNFESASGIEGTEVTPLLSDEDRHCLKDFLQRLRHGKSKVIITSRSSETWLTTTVCYRLPLEGLRGEECWLYCNAVVRDLGLTLDRSDKTYSDLMEKLDGHPLAMRAVLLRLEQTSASSLLKALEQGFVGAAQDDSTARIYAALALLEASFPPQFNTVLPFIGLHQRYVDLGSLEAMAKNSEAATDRTTIEACCVALERAGLIHPQGNGIYAMHPALNGYLRQHHPAGTAVQRAFVDLMGSFADLLAPKQLHEQRAPFYWHGANFYFALSLAMLLDMVDAIAALTQSLAVFAENNRDFQSAERLCANLADHCSQYHNDKGVAIAYHQLGIIAEKQRNFAQAEQWYQKSLAISEKQDNEYGAAMTYHQLGMIAEAQRDYAQAEQWYLKSLTIKEKQGNQHGAANTYHHFGRIAEEQRDYVQAEQWYQKSLAIDEKQGNEHGAASTYHQLGSIAQEQGDYAEAEQWCLKSLAIFEKHGNEHGAAMTYHQLGIIAEEQRDFAQAEQWYLKSLAIKEKQGNEHGAASTYNQLGLLKETQQHWIEAAQWFIKAAVAFISVNDGHLTARVAKNYVDLLQQSDELYQDELKKLWQQSGLEQSFASLDTIITALNEAETEENL